MIYYNLILYKKIFVFENGLNLAGTESQKWLCFKFCPLKLHKIILLTSVVLHLFYLSFNGNFLNIHNKVTFSWTTKMLKFSPLKDYLFIILLFSLLSLRTVRFKTYCRSRFSFDCWAVIRARIFMMNKLFNWEYCEAFYKKKWTDVDSSKLITLAFKKI